MMFFNMKFSSIIKQSINFRNSLIDDGYYVDCFKTDKICHRKHWILKHPNGHERYITLDFMMLAFCVYNESGKTLIKLIADA